MEPKTLAPILAGIGIGWLAFSAEGQKLAKGLGQSILPALANGGQQAGIESESGKEGEDKKESESKKDKEED